jgi:hypothetical protein
MTKIEWNVNNCNPSYQTPDGDISVKLQVGDDVDLMLNGYEYTVSVNIVNLSKYSEGIVKSQRQIGIEQQPNINIGEKIRFNFNNVFSVNRR